MRTVVASLADLLFPPACACCGAPPPPGDRLLCAACRGSLTTVHAAHPLYAETRSRLCEEGLIDDLSAAFVFEEGGCLQTVIHRLKYGGMPFLGAELGAALAARLSLPAAEGMIPLLLPVPLHRSKERERGYNQSEEICRGIARALGLPVASRVLLRVRPTASQTGLSRTERRANVAGAFTLRTGTAASVRGATVLLVDDVITTGATALACARVLRDAGAGVVHACCVGLAP